MTGHWTSTLMPAFVVGGLMLVHLCAQGQEPAAAPPAVNAPVIRLMNAGQYANEIAYVFGSDIKAPLRLPSFRRVDGLAGLGAGSALVPAGTFNIFYGTAQAVAEQVVGPAHRDLLIPCKPKEAHMPDDVCAGQFLGKVGHLIFHRPLSADVLRVCVKAAHETGERLQNFYAGLQYALTGMLVAPEFLYLVEEVEPDPRHPGVSRLDGPSRAMRLGLLLWNAPPDVELLRAAESGELQTTAGTARQVGRMLASPLRLENGIRAFFSDMLLLDAFPDLVKDPIIYPDFTAKVATDSSEQILQIISDQLLTRQGDYRDIFTTRRIFLTQALATLYRIPISIPSSLDWAPYDLPDNDPRAGILTQVGFLSVNSHPGRSSATRRGKALRENFMCQTVPEPPPNVDFSAIENPDPRLRTARERLDMHRKNPVCAGCHKITDPLGLPLESFDGAGKFRATENGAEIDTSGSFSGKQFQDARGLAAAVHDDPAITSCLVRRLYEYGVGRRISAEEKSVVRDLESGFKDAGYRFVPLLRAIATSAAFYSISATVPDATRTLSTSLAGSSRH